jgi:RNA polymerase sigma-70 factor (ECF subfamily)
MAMLRLIRREESARPVWSELSDRDVLEHLRQGEERALEELVARKTKPLLQAAVRILNDMEEARDIVQVTFLKVWENRDKFDDRWSPNTWIYRIATNLAIDHLRARQSRERSVEPARHHFQLMADNTAGTSGPKFAEREVGRIFAELSEELTEKQRAIFVLREVEGRTSEEVAAIVGCRESTVRNHLFHARKLLRELLRSRYPEYCAGRLAAAPAHRASTLTEDQP